MTTPTYPLFLDLSGRGVLVVGAGPIATRRARGLLDAGAIVTVVAPAATQDVVAWHTDPGTALTWKARRFAVADVAGCWLVQAATGQTPVDTEVVDAAARAGVWAVRASAAGASPAWSATTVTGDDDVRVAVSGGRDPGRARVVRDAVAVAMRAGDLPLRRRRRRPAADGRVSLVGAGPGDPDLLTLRGWRRLRAADVVVVDHLAPRGLLDNLDSDVEVQYAGKMPGHHHLAQQQINALLVERAQAGLRVVRLKGGDPFVLGRGGEEAQACVRAGVPVEVVPGITSACAVPAAAGIPLTHRGIASSFVLVSGHAPVSQMLRQVGQAPSDATIVVLMGTRTLRASAAALVRHGRSAATPVAIIERGWTPQQRVLTATLADVADVADSAGACPPAVVVIGGVVALRNEVGDLAVPSPDAGHTDAGDVSDPSSVAVS